MSKSNSIGLIKNRYLCDHVVGRIVLSEGSIDYEYLRTYDFFEGIVVSTPSGSFPVTDDYSIQGIFPLSSDLIVNKRNTVRSWVYGRSYNRVEHKPRYYWAYK